MEYPRILYANVLLLDDTIINWKTGNKDWSDGGWSTSRQPYHLILNLEDHSRLRSETFCKIVNNIDENELFFRVTSKEFYRHFEIREDYTKGMFGPY